MTEESTLENSVSAGAASDVKITALAVMTPLLPGLLVLVGYVWLGGFGILLGLAAAIAWCVWWYRRNGRKFFPRDVRTGPFVITIVLTVLLLIAALVS